MTPKHGRAPQCPWWYRYQYQYQVVCILKNGRRILRESINGFFQEHLSQIQHHHSDVTVQQWSMQVDHIHVVLVIPPKYAVSYMLGKMKANLSRQLRLRYPDLKRTYWGRSSGLLDFFLQPWG